MKWLKKAISLTVATAIMAAATDVSNVMAAENTYEGVVLSADEVSEESDFVIEDGVLKSKRPIARTFINISRISGCF